MLLFLIMVRFSSLYYFMATVILFVDGKCTENRFLPLASCLMFVNWDFAQQWSRCWCLLHCVYTSDTFLGRFLPEWRTWIARADLHADSSPFPIGTLIFTQPNIPGSPVRVFGQLFNLIPNTKYHGFHVHNFALPNGEWNCSRAGDHWNPYGTSSSALPTYSNAWLGKVHGDRYDSIERRHVGDLGNIWWAFLVHWLFIAPSCLLVQGLIHLVAQ